eukprot:6710522-Prymnesium_polylepis.1
MAWLRHFQHTWPIATTLGRESYAYNCSARGAAATSVGDGRAGLRRTARPFVTLQQARRKVVFSAMYGADDRTRALLRVQGRWCRGAVTF